MRITIEIFRNFKNVPTATNVKELDLILDSITVGNSYTQIPGLVLCGIWFGKISISSNVFIGHFRNGLICSIASFLCGSLYFFQILIKNFSNNSVVLYFPSIKNIFAQVFITGLLAPLICSSLLILFQKSRGKDKLISFIDK